MVRKSKRIVYGNAHGPPIYHAIISFMYTQIAAGRRIYTKDKDVNVRHMYIVQYSKSSIENETAICV